MAIRRLDEATAETRARVRADPVVAAEGAVRLIEKLSPAFENVDDSIGRLQAVIREVFEQFVPVIGTAEVVAKTRRAWLGQLWHAMAVDGYLRPAPVPGGVLDAFFGESVA